MAESRKLLEQSASGVTIGSAGLGVRGAALGSVNQNVHDGDTVFVRAFGNISIRFLVIDTPELSFTPPGSTAFVATDKQAWVEALTDPFSGWDAAGKLGADLVAYLQPKTSCAAARVFS